MTNVIAMRPHPNTTADCPDWCDTDHEPNDGMERAHYVLLGGDVPVVWVDVRHDEAGRVEHFGLLPCDYEGTYPRDEFDAAISSAERMASTYAAAASFMRAVMRDGIASREAWNIVDADKPIAVRQAERLERAQRWAAMHEWLATDEGRSYMDSLHVEQ